MVHALFFLWLGGALVAFVDGPGFLLSKRTWWDLAGAIFWPIVFFTFATVSLFLFLRGGECAVTSFWRDAGLMHEPKGED